MFLMPNGKEVVIETRDGESHEIQIEMFYNPARVKTYWEDRTDLWYGANNYMFIRGNTTILDIEILDAVLKAQQIDTNNVAYSYDVTPEFTWDYREMVEIKKRKKRVDRYYKPTLKNLYRLIGLTNF